MLNLSKEPMGVWRVVLISFEVLFSNLFKFVPLMVLAIALASLYFFIITHVFGYSAEMLKNLKHSNLPPEELKTIAAHLMWPYCLLSGIYNLIFFHRINAIISREPGNIIKSIWWMFKNLFKVIGALILGSITLAVAFFAKVLIIPYAILYMILAFYYPLFVSDDLKILGAYIDAVRFTFRRFWRNLFLFFIVMPLLGIILIAPIVGLILGFKDLITINAQYFIIIVYSLIVTAILWLMYKIAIYVQAQNLKISA